MPLRPRSAPQRNRREDGIRRLDLLALATAVLAALTLAEGAAATGKACEISPVANGLNICQVLLNQNVGFLAVSNIGGAANGKGDLACRKVIEKLREWRILTGP